MTRKSLIISLSVVLLLLTAFSVDAQRKVYLCENYTQSGQPVGSDIEWTMPATGAGVYVLFTNGGDLIPWQTMYMIIDRYVDGEYKEVETITLTPDQSKAWLVVDQMFYKAGNYKITMSNKSGDPVASIIFDILIQYSENEDDGNSLAKVYFCLSIDDDGNPVDSDTKFYVDKKDGSYIYIYIDNKEAFGTTGLDVKVWRGSGYSEFVETKELTIDSDWEATYFKYTLRKADEYKVAVYKEDGTFIRSAYVTIDYK